MDNSISKALIMVAGVLLAMIVIAFIAHSFMQIGNWATTSDQETLTKQIQEFNKEYEVYDKALMYGVDVISCLNKARSNNERIINKAVVNGDAYDESYEVKVSIEITKKDLQESIIVYCTQGNNREIETSNWDSGYKLAEMNPKFEFLESNVSKFKEYYSLKTQYEDTEMKIGKYELTYNKIGTNETILRKQLDILKGGDLSEVVQNKKLEYKTSDGKIWTKAVYRSALYDLKTRKFKCVAIKYGANSRINYIEFKEI